MPITTISLEDICLWSDRTYCHREDLSFLGHMSDDYEVLHLDSYGHIMFSIEHV